MAKRVVVFDNGDVRSSVVRKKPEPPKAKPVAKSKPKEVVKSKAKPKKPALDIFLEFYLKDVQEAAGRAYLIMNNEERTDRKYFAEKYAFLENVLAMVRDGEPGNREFSPLSEPFFYNEWKRLYILAASCTIQYSPPQQKRGRKAFRLGPAWRKAATFVNRLLFPCYAEIRLKRDGYPCRFVPSSIQSLAVDMNGTMMHLERQIQENPSRDDLRELYEMYRTLYWRSGFFLTAQKLMREFQEGKKGMLKYWKNKETVDYLIDWHMDQLHQLEQRRQSRESEQAQAAPRM